MTFHPARAFWDAAYRAGDHLQHWESGEPAAEIAALLGDERTDGPALDLGCGAGRQAEALAAQGFRTVGLDLSISGLAIAQQRIGRHPMAWVAGSAFALPLRDRSIELILDRGCFHAFETGQRHRYAGEVERVLRPDGRLLLWGAAAPDPDAGLYGLDPGALRHGFPATRWHLVWTRRMSLEAACETRPGLAVLLAKQGSAGTPQMP